MREMAAFLGYGDCEIFPKQVTILAERGDVGQWINMPYFSETKTERYAVNELGKKLSLQEFVKVAQSKVTTPEELATLVFRDDNQDALSEGPPCLNALAARGFPMGSRNNGLFNLGIYAQKFDADNWEQLLHTYNNKFMTPPLTPIEVVGVIKSLKKSKGYNYTCKQQPICSFCNSGVCRSKKFGVGMQNLGMPKYGTLCKIATNPPIWFVDVEGSKRLELETEDLQYIKKYQTRCMESLNIMPPTMKGDIWNEIITKLMEDVTVVEVPEEATPKGMLRQYIEEFCTSRVQAKNRDEIILGKPWTDQDRVYFRMRDLIAFLERQRFKEFAMNRIAVYLRDWGATKHFMNIKSGGSELILYLGIQEETGSAIRCS